MFSNPAKELPELPLFEFKGLVFRFDPHFKEVFINDCVKKLKNLANEPEWLLKFFKHFIVFLYFLIFIYLSIEKYIIFFKIYHKIIEIFDREVRRFIISRGNRGI